MLTQSLIQDKLRELEGLRVQYQAAENVNVLDAEIKRLKWVLEIGPDSVFVPKPKGVK